MNLGRITISEISTDRIEIVDMQCSNSLRLLYDTNADFRRYVDRHARHHGISTEEALEHALVRNYAEYLEKGEIG